MTASAEESFSEASLEYPQYTRPAEYRGMKVPEVLLSGNHAAVEAWRRDRPPNARPNAAQICLKTTTKI